MNTAAVTNTVSVPMPATLSLRSPTSERRGNRMNGVLDAAKAKDLGWRTQRGGEDYIASIVEDSA